MASVIAKYRERAGLSQVALAELTGINVRLIRKYEYGEYSADNMTLKNASIIANALSCNIEDLMEGEKTMNIQIDSLRKAIKKEYAAGCKWRKRDFGNFFHMMIDLSDGEIWSDCLSSGDTRRYKSDTITRLPVTAVYGDDKSGIERELLESAIEMLTGHGWEVTGI